MRILLADSNALMREGLKAVLTSLGEDVQIIEAKGIDGAAEAVERPGDFAIALVDPTDEQADRFDRLRALGERLAPTPLVVIAPEEDRREAVHALQNGASGYLPKSLPVDVLLSALRLVLAGGVYAPPKLLLGTVTGSPGVRRVEVNGPTGSGGALTERQRDVLAYLAQGKSNKEIAAELQLSESTVKVHVNHILKALKVKNRSQAALIANGLEI